MKYRRPNKPSLDKGFTLTELMTTIAVVGVLVAVGVPSLNSFTLSNKLTSYTNDFVASVSLSRSEAVKLNNAVTLCASSCAAASTTCACATTGGWDQGWVLLWDSQGDGNLSDDATDVLYRHAALDTGLSFNESANLRSLVFQPSGFGSTQATLKLCQSTPSVGPKEKIITVSATGRTSVRTERNASCP